ncbi:MAG: hypothetical protein OEV62_00815 [Actinomycetota bacterium]|nr:hypothetical protein [Actinomycetota bacterium]
MPSPGGAAFFDLDRTLIAGSANFALAVAAFGSDLVGPADLARDALNAVGFVVRGADDARSEALRDRACAPSRVGTSPSSTPWATGSSRGWPHRSSRRPGVSWRGTLGPGGTG